MEIKLGFSMLGRMFMMPASVVDEYLKISTGEQIKVLMCIYCLGCDTVKTEDIAAMSGVPEQTVREAVIHFSKLGVFTASGITGAQESAKPAPVSPVQAENKPHDDLRLIGQPEAIRGTARDTSRDSRVRYTPKEIAAKIESDGELGALMQEMEKIMGRQLTHSNVGDVLEMYEHLELDPASIQMISEYCKSLDKCKTAYILRVAQEWYDEGVCDFEQIERKIINLGQYNSLEAKIKRLIGLQGTATKKQRTYMHSWQDMGFGFEMIKLAYEETVDNTGKLSFPYMDRILHDWHQKGINTPDALVRDKEKFKKDKQQTSDSGSIGSGDVQRFADSIDFDKLTN